MGLQRPTHFFFDKWHTEYLKLLFVCFKDSKAIIQNQIKYLMARAREKTKKNSERCIGEKYLTFSMLL